MDTDSALMAISGDSFESIIKPDLRKEFEKDKHNWFITPLAPKGKHISGLFKVESLCTVYDGCLAKKEEHFRKMTYKLT